MVIMPHFSLNPCPLKLYFFLLSDGGMESRDRALFCYPLSLSWPWDVLWPIESCGSDNLPVSSLAPKRSFTVHSENPASHHVIRPMFCRCCMRTTWFTTLPQTTLPSGQSLHDLQSKPEELPS
uniref:Uncharacterized protein n=1 Tax=Pipistrellus kuhlii TaxID=59472 RepID=A0A7J7XVY5_PIPKU|nr:hypothetical protein mPipKuh1_010483 [Pipistrellus kuhlii]